MIVAHISFTLPAGKVRPLRSGQEAATCHQILNITDKQLEGIVSGEAKPSMTLIRKYKLYTAGDGKLQFDGRKWKQLGLYQKLQVFYEDHAEMIGAISFTIKLL